MVDVVFMLFLFEDKNTKKKPKPSRDIKNQLLKNACHSL